MSRDRRHRDQRGTSILEFIVVLPTLLVVLFAIVELSRAWLTLNIVTTAVREGARVGVVTNPFDPTPAIARINNVLGSANLIADSVTVTCTGPCDRGSEVRADVTVTFQTLFPVFLPMLQTLPMQQRASMRYE